jgi:hypothetical protein
LTIRYIGTQAKRGDLELPNKIVILGMSCVGKTTFAKSLGRQYYCFDMMFQWHQIETFGLSLSENLKFVQTTCVGDRFVLDGWNLADAYGEFFPVGATPCVVFSSYDRILGQYRIPVMSRSEYAPMYLNWYGLDFERFRNVCYIENCGEFVERTADYFRSFRDRQFAELQHLS